MRKRPTLRAAQASTPPPRSSAVRQTRPRKAGIAAMTPLLVSLAAGALPSARPPAARGPEPAPPPHTALTGPIFNPGCPLPFPGVPNPPSDGRCPIQGGSSDAAKQLESKAKNNFCASTPSPIPVTYQDLIALQTASAGLPKKIPDRSILTNIDGKLGEGKYVSYIAFVKNAHYSDVGKGEAVNCNIGGQDTNDIHIVLLQNPSDDECKSTTAEMSPHFRPPTWTPDAINATIGHPVRVRGQVFYDGSHSPCTATSRPNPQRASLWEIHPVYSFEVCKVADLAQCKDTDTPNWVALEDWVSTENSENQ